MPFWWTTRPARQPVHSRPRVQRAIQAARHASELAPVGLGSARVDEQTLTSLHHLDVIERAAISGPLHKSQRRAKRGLETELIWATARAAEKAGRRPEEVWAEALRDWLASREALPVSRPQSFELRRQQVWNDIDFTLAGLRVS